MSSSEQSDPDEGEPAPDVDALGASPVDDSEILYRRLFDGGPNMVTTDVVTGEQRPSSGAFKPDEDGVSVFRQVVLEAAGLGPADVRKAPSNLVASVLTAELRSEEMGLDVVPDPWPQDTDDADHPRNAAHALVTGFEGLGKNARRRRQQALVALASAQIVRV